MYNWQYDFFLEGRICLITKVVELSQFPPDCEWIPQNPRENGGTRIAMYYVQCSRV